MCGIHSRANFKAGGTHFYNKQSVVCTKQSVAVYAVLLIYEIKCELNNPYVHCCFKQSAYCYTILSVSTDGDNL